MCAAAHLLEGCWVEVPGPGTARLLPTEIVKWEDWLHWLACISIGITCFVLVLLSVGITECYLAAGPGGAAHSPAHRGHGQPDPLPGPTWQHPVGQSSYEVFSDAFETSQG